MGQIQSLLQISAKLYQHLSIIPTNEERDGYIEQINTQLDARGQLIQQLEDSNFTIDSSNKTHVTLIELDKGIRERLNKVMDTVKGDMKELQNQKKNEKQYMNPYADVSTMDGRYYDKKQ